MDAGLDAGLEVARQQVGVEIAQQENHLEEEEAGGPDGGRSPKPGQDDFGDDRLHLEEQEGAQQDRGCVEEHYREMCRRQWRAAAATLSPVSGGEADDLLFEHSGGGWVRTGAGTGRGGVGGTEVGTEPIRPQNGSNPSVCVRKLRSTVVGQVFNLRPISNRPPASVCPSRPGGLQTRRRLKTCPT